MLARLHALTEAENAQLRQENARLREENERLRRENDLGVESAVSEVESASRAVEDGLRTELAGLEHWHGRADAVEARRTPAERANTLSVREDIALDPSRLPSSGFDLSKMAVGSLAIAPGDNVTADVRSQLGTGDQGISNAKFVNIFQIFQP